MQRAGESGSLVHPYTLRKFDYLEKLEACCFFFSTNTNRVLKCDVTNISIYEIMGFLSIFGKSMMKKAYLPKISILLQFGSEILALLCLDDSIQILLILSQFLALGTQTKLEGLYGVIGA